MALRAQVVNFVRLDFLDDAYQVTGVGQITVVQDEVAVANVGVLVQVVYALCVQRRGAALDAMHDVAFGQEQFSQVRAVLARNASDQGCFQFNSSSVRGHRGLRLFCRYT